MIERCKKVTVLEIRMVALKKMLHLRQVAKTCSRIAVDRLRNYSFVSVGEHGRTFEMHGVVQLATRKWLKMHGENE